MICMDLLACGDGREDRECLVEVEAPPGAEPVVEIIGAHKALAPLDVWQVALRIRHRPRGHRLKDIAKADESRRFVAPALGLEQEPKASRIWPSPPPGIAPSLGCTHLAEERSDLDHAQSAPVADHSGTRSQLNQPAGQEQPLNVVEVARSPCAHGEILSQNRALAHLCFYITTSEFRTKMARNSIFLFGLFCPILSQASKAWIPGGSMTAVTLEALLDTNSVAITQQGPLLESIREINLRFLLSVHAALEAGLYESRPELGVAHSYLKSLAPKDFGRISQFPFLMMDLGMSEDDGVDAVLKRYESVKDKHHHPHRETHLAIARSALIAGWHAARTDPIGAYLLFGVSKPIIPKLAALPLHEIEALAPVCVSPMTLRWRTNPSLWDELLNPRAYTSVDTVRGFVMHAVQLAATTHLK